MAQLRRSERQLPPFQGLSARAKSFVFFDKNSGARRFEIKADHNGRMPVDQAVSFLAVHCLARRQAPEDFEILVGVRGDLISDLASRASMLIDSCSVSPVPGLTARLTRRQTEVLMGITQTLTNKEIASRLNLSERTVKFHVSTLLEKFHVRSRLDLMLETEGLFLGTANKTASHRQANLMNEEATAPVLLSLAASATPGSSHGKDRTGDFRNGSNLESKSECFRRG